MSLHPLKRSAVVALALATIAIVCGALLLVSARPDAAPAEVPHSFDSPAGWTALYTENFDTDAKPGDFAAVYGEAWNGYTGIADTSGEGMYTPDKVLSVHDSALDFYLHTEDGVHLVAAPLPNGFEGTTYGRYSIRLKTEVIPGYKIAFLMWPTSDLWNDGEIDYPEGNLDGTPFYGASVIPGSHVDGAVSWDPSKPYAPTNAEEWHTATLEWTPGLLKYFWDDELIGESALPDSVPTLPMRWTLQAETNLSGEPVPDSSAGHLMVDWVKAWTYTPGTPAK